MVTKRDTEFESLIGSAITMRAIGAYVGIFVLLLFGIFCIYYAVKLPFIPLLIVGLIPLGGIALMIYRFRGDLKGESYWINMLANQPEKIIWIKPIQIRHTAAYVITLYREMHFELLNDQGLSFSFKCDSAEEQAIFFRGIKAYIPHAHIGYSDHVKYAYDTNRSQFIESLKRDQLYLSVEQLDAATAS